MEENNLELVDKHGPPSGLSTTTVYTYRLSKADNPPPKKKSLLLSLQGAGKNAFSQLGGGETFLKEERTRWNEATVPVGRRKR